MSATTEQFQNAANSLRLAVRVLMKYPQDESILMNLECACRRFDEAQQALTWSSENQGVNSDPLEEMEKFWNKFTSTEDYSNLVNNFPNVNPESGRAFAWKGFLYSWQAAQHFFGKKLNEEIMRLNALRTESKNADSANAHAIEIMRGVGKNLHKQIEWRDKTIEELSRQLDKIKDALNTPAPATPTKS